MLKQRGNFRLGDIMRSSHNVHLSNQNMKCSPRVALYTGHKMFLKGSGCGGDICKKV